MCQKSLSRSCFEPKGLSRVQLQLLVFTMCNVYLGGFLENGSPHHSFSLIEMSLVPKKPTQEHFYMEVIIRNN